LILDSEEMQEAEKASSAGGPREEGRMSGPGLLLLTYPSCEQPFTLCHLSGESLPLFSTCSNSSRVGGPCYAAVVLGRLVTGPETDLEPSSADLQSGALSGHQTNLTAVSVRRSWGPLPSSVGKLPWGRGRHGKESGQGLQNPWPQRGLWFSLKKSLIVRLKERGCTETTG
jgi:hypothetical protein